MSDGTKIEWTDATANVINGCSLESPGCTNCYAMKQAHRTPVRQGLTVKTKGGMVWTGEVRFHEPALLKVLSWQKPRMIFWNAHGDAFHPDVPIEWIDRCFAAALVKDQHVHQFLTKRSARMLEYCRTLPDRADLICEAARKNGSTLLDCYDVRAAARAGLVNARHIWLGVSVEDQARADERVPDLLATPAAVRWLSCEPLLGPVDLRRVLHRDMLGKEVALDALTGEMLTGTPDLANGEHREPWTEKLDWIVGGFESGPNARPGHPDMARSLRDQCATTGTAFFWKQNGEFAPGEIAGEYLDPERPAKGMRYFDGRWEEDWSHPEGHADDEPDVYRIGKKRAGRLLDGRVHDGFPA
jgi:protein gp37